MRITGRLIVALVLILAASGAVALETGTDLLVPAAVRGTGRNQSTWITDLYLHNPGSETAQVDILWLKRNRANPDPTKVSLSLPAGRTLILDDVILETLGMSKGSGAFRIVSDRPVAVNSRSYNLKGEVTFGSGFEGVPRSRAVAAGGSTDVIGLRHNAAFRTNIVLMEASGSGSTVELSLIGSGGDELASKSYELRGFEPKLFLVTDLGVTTFDDATLHVEVQSGAAIAFASKVDNDEATGDPMTLQPVSPGPELAGTHQFSILDSQQFATGGELVISQGSVQSISGTYCNWEKLSGSNPACTLLFAWGGSLSTPTSVDDLTSGVTIEAAYSGGGEITYSIQLQVDSGVALTGTISAVGSGFTGQDSGCNGTFPPLSIRGGKSSSVVSK